MPRISVVPKRYRYTGGATTPARVYDAVIKHSDEVVGTQQISTESGVSLPRTLELLNHMVEDGVVFRQHDDEGMPLDYWYVPEQPPLRYKKDICRAYILSRSGRCLKRQNVQDELRKHGIEVHNNTVIDALLVLRAQGLARLTTSAIGRASQWIIAEIQEDVRKDIQKMYEDSVRLYQEWD